MIYETFREAVKNIWSNKFRTVLTMLGIIIGVTAVIVIVGLGNGMTQSIKDSFSEMGTNVLSVQITGRGSRTVTVQQMYDIVDSHPEVFTGMSPTTTLDSTVKVDTTTYGYTSVKGVSETYLDMMGRTLAQGRGLTYVDITDNKKVCVVGDYIARAAYGGNAIYDHGHHGNAILSRHAILSQANQDVSDHRFESRGLLHCEVKIAGIERPVHCVCVHLGLTAGSRRRQMAALVRRLDALAEFTENQAAATGRSDLAEHAAMYRRDARRLRRE